MNTSILKEFDRMLDILEVLRSFNKDSTVNDMIQIFTSEIDQKKSLWQWNCNDCEISEPTSNI